MPEPKEKQAEEVTGVSLPGVRDAIGGKGSMDDVMKNAPLIYQEDDSDPIVYPEGQGPKQATAPKKESAPIPATDQQIKPEGINQGEQQQKDQPKLIKIGDIELTEDEWKEAHKDHTTKSNWLSKLTKYSQIQKYIGDNDEKLQQLTLFATGREELPENFMDSVNLPETIDIPDSDGIIQRFETKDLPKNVIEALKWQAIKEMLPEAINLREENQKLKTRVEEFDQEQAVSGETYMRDFIEAVPDLHITVESGQGLAEALELRRSLPDHPEHDSAIKILAVMSTVRDLQISAPKAYKALFGKSVDESKMKMQIKKNQMEYASHGTVSSEAPPPINSDDEFIRNMSDQKAAKINKLFG